MGRPRSFCEDWLTVRRRAQQSRHSGARRRLLQQILRDAKSCPCADCGKMYPPDVMDLDHVRGTKLYAPSRHHVARVVEGFVGREDMLRAEIAKCDVRCPTCHRLRHYFQDHPDERETWLPT